jgi:hypothetical protein
LAIQQVLRGYYEGSDGLDHKELALYSHSMRSFGLILFFMWGMVAWMISCGVAVGVRVAVLIEVLGYAGGGTGEIVDALGLGAFIEGFFGVLPGVLCGAGPVVLTLALRRLPERTSRYRMITVAVCVGALFVPAGLLALLANDHEGVGAMLFLPTTLQLYGIPLLISAPFAALGAQGVAMQFSRRARVEPH